ncbi:MAG TPA: CxxxxCH/CxxCH domain-containing protein [Candidatus Deferrimicrobiaceae bacterium]
MQNKAQRFSLAAGTILAAILVVYAASSVYAGVVNSPHDFSVATGLSTKSSTIAPDGVCSACHIPHGAQDNVLWARPLSGGVVNGNSYGNYRTPLTLDGSSNKPNYLVGFTLQCYDCHDYHFSGGIDDFPAFNNFQSSHRPQDIAFGFQTKKRDSTITTDSSLTMKTDPPVGSYSGYYENSPPFPSNYGANASLTPRTDNTMLAKTGGHYFKSGDPGSGLYKGDKLPCSDCHDPHKWYENTTTGRQAFFSPRIQSSDATRWSNLFGSSPVTASTYMANPLQNAVMSRNDAGSRKLCIVCHSTTDGTSPVTFTNINLKYSNPTPYIVRPPAGITEHASASTVACVSCHQHNMIDASCSMCHGYPPSDTATVAYPTSFTPFPAPGADVDSHARHIGNKQSLPKGSSGPYNFACGVCHNTTLHQNTKVSITIQGAWTKNGGVYDNTNYFNPAFPGPTGELDNSSASGGWGGPSRSGGNSCKNVYCHSAGRVQTSMALDCTVDYRIPVWLSGKILCNGCHGYGTTTTPNPTYGTLDFGMPSYVNGGVASGKANSHYAHVVKNGIECTTCHFGIVTGSGATRAIIETAVPTAHVNGLRDIGFDTGIVTGSPNYDNTTQTCTVSCHGSGALRWGQTGLSCFSCHSGIEPASKPQPNAGFPSPVDNVQYLSTGHGRTAALGNYPPNASPDLNPPAHFDNVAGAVPDCYVCHAMLSRHIGRTANDLSNDPYRLGSARTSPVSTGGLGNFTGPFGDNVDTLCLGCHGNAAQRAGHDNQAKGTRTVDAQTHATGISGTKYTWPIPAWKCVDCHDPHGDANWKMLRSAINAPRTQTDTQAGSDKLGTPLRTTGLDCVVFQSVAGQGPASYASSPSTGQGICEICHNQTFTYRRGGAGAQNGHPTTRCSQCHTHPAGFKGASCKGCHGGDDGTGLVINNAPNIAKYWLTSGHGKYSTSLPLAVNPIQCEDCHDISYLSGADHKTSGAAGLTDPPTNTNTLMWPSKSGTADTSPTKNTSHLKSSFFPVSPTRKMDYALAFDAKCGSLGVGCHTWTYPTSHVGHAHPNTTVSPYDNVLTFGRPHANTPPAPKLYSWYPVIGAAPDYLNRFYETPAVWLIQDLTTNADNVVYGDNGAGYGTCITCHDPHGSNAPINVIGATTNKMMRGDIGSSTQSFFCNTACHGN